MRGKLCNFHQTLSLLRITPAYAGKTLWEKPGLRLLWDHPRRGGENLFLDLPVAALEGSPPRMRGKLVCKNSGLESMRITPADAGKTVCTTTHTPVQWDHPRVCGENS